MAEVVITQEAAELFRRLMVEHIQRRARGIHGAGAEAYLAKCLAHLSGQLIVDLATVADCPTAVLVAWATKLR